MLSLMIKNQNLKAGFSLVEVMIGIVIFSILAAGVASATLLTSKIAYSNIYRNTAFTVAQGYGEQIKSIRYAVVKDALDDPSTVRIPTKSLSLGTSDSMRLDDPLIFGQRTLKEIVVDIEEANDGTLRERVMRMWFTPTGRDLSKETDQLNAIEVTLTFEWEVIATGITRVHQDAIKIVKTDVSEF